MTSHDYAVAGTFVAKLTVTDDDSATAASTQNVAVTAPPPVGQLASDAFDRNVVGGWGSATLGGAWAVSSVASRFGVASGVGSILLPAGSGGTANLPGFVATSTDVRLILTTDKPGTGGGVYVSIAGRRVATAGSYQAKVIIAPLGKVSIALVRVNSTGGAETVLQTAVVATGITFAPGMKLAVRVRVTGVSPTTIQARVWQADLAEPSTWQRTVTDSTAGMQVGGGTGITGYLSSSATNSPITLSVDDLAAQVP
jgi:hypothetical protein